MLAPVIIACSSICHCNSVDIMYTHSGVNLVANLHISRERHIHENIKSVRAGVSVCLCMCVCAHACVCMCAFMCTCMYVCVCACVNVCVVMCECISVCVCVCWLYVEKDHSESMAKECFGSSHDLDRCFLFSCVCTDGCDSIL